MPYRQNILFTQAQTYYASDARIHGALMRHLDRDRFVVHAAVNAGWGGVPSPSLQALRQIPALHIHPVRFTPSSHGRSRLAVAAEAARGVWPMARGLVGMVRYARRARIDVVHCLDKARDTAYGLIAARLCGAKLVIHIHVKVEDWVSPVVRGAMRRADALVAISQFVRQSIVAAGYPDGRVRVVLNGMDLAGWEAAPDAPVARWEFGVTPGAPLLVSVGRLFRWKGQGDLIRALARVAPQVPDARLLLVGEDDRLASRGVSTRAELEALARELGVAERVIFAGQRGDVARLLAAADIFALPSFEEPFGMVYLEAMALRRPVIGLDNGGTREVVEHGRTGLLSPPGDIDALAANIARLAREPMTRARMGMAGRRRLEERFTAQRMAADMARVYAELCGGAPLEAPYGEGQLTGVGRR